MTPLAGPYPLGLCLEEDLDTDLVRLHRGGNPRRDTSRPMPRRVDSLATPDAKSTRKRVMNNCEFCISDELGVQFRLLKVEFWVHIVTTSKVVTIRVTSK